VPIWANVTDAEWSDWKWQVRNRITTIDDLKQVINLTPEEEIGIARCLESLRMAITPYYAMQMDPANPACPVRKQAVPLSAELTDADWSYDDPLHEEADSPVPGITHRYPDRVLFLVTDQCSMYCRHCTRRRMVGCNDQALPSSNIDRAIDYIRKNQRIIGFEEYHDIEDDSQFEEEVAVRSMLESLPEKYRTMIIMKYQHNMNATEIGERVGLSPSTVRTHLSTAMGILRKNL
jgi:hypothetical protein